MVTRPARGRSRGQLLLVGAVVLAAVVVGLVIVVNSSLFIENAEGPDASSGVTEVSKIDYNLRQAARTVTLRVNHATTGQTAAELATRVDQNVSALSRITRVTLVASQSTVVNATYDNSSSAYGMRVVQGDDGYLTDDGEADGDVRWEPVQGQNIGWFVLNLNVSEMGSTPVTTTATNDDGDTVTITMERVNSPSPDVRITSSVNGGPGSTVTCDPTNRRLLLDLRSGESFVDEDCRFDGTTSIRNASTVEFDGGDDTLGRYSVVANDTGAVSDVTGGLPACPSATDDEPCRSPVVWSANITVTVQNSRTAYENSHNVSVYEVNR